MIKRSIVTLIGAGMASMALALTLDTAAVGTASAQQLVPPPPASPCAQFQPLTDVARKRGEALGAAQKHHPDRKEMCTLVSQFYTAEAAVVKFLETNQQWCGVPPQAIQSAKATHEKTLKFKEVVCAPAPAPKVPTLSDAIGTPKLDTAKNTKTGHGTFDTLTGNPLAK
ncbi:MAG TPA: hypothetical protein VFA80_19960 [Xanthobacteraceae bacterium]|jgi:hypothetical protein|nr:hypothetical protein [Xanthobacteraceae bacterium]